MNSTPSSSSFTIHLVYYLEPMKPSHQPFNKIVETQGNKTLHQLCSVPSSQSICSLFCFSQLSNSFHCLQHFNQFSDLTLSEFCQQANLKGDIFTFYLFLFEKTPSPLFKNTVVNNLYFAQLLIHNYDKQKSISSLFKLLNIHQRFDLVRSLAEDLVSLLPNNPNSSKIIEQLLTTAAKAREYQTIDLTQSSEDCNQPELDASASVPYVEVSSEVLNETETIASTPTTPPKFYELEKELKRLQKHKQFLTKLKKNGQHIRSHYNLRKK